MYMLTRLRLAPDTSMLLVACLISSSRSTLSTYGHRPASIISPRTFVLWSGIHSYTHSYYVVLLSEHFTVVLPFFSMLLSAAFVQP